MEQGKAWSRMPYPVPPMFPSCQGGRIGGVTGVILAGGQSSRMGSNKALLPYQGGRFIEAIYRQLRDIFVEVILVTNTPEQYPFLPCRKVPDLYPGAGALAGVHSGLYHSQQPRSFVVACDMPYLDASLIRHIASCGLEHDVVVPGSGEGLEPLHALYAKSCLDAMEECLQAGKRRIISFYPQVAVKVLESSDIARFDPAFASFSNINTPEEYFRLRNEERGENLVQLPRTLPLQSAR